MKKQKRQRTLFESDFDETLLTTPDSLTDPFLGPLEHEQPAKQVATIEVKDNFTKELYKRKSKNTSLPIPQKHMQPAAVPQGGRQIIHGNIPSKSNCYKIIYLHPAKDAKATLVECPDCKGYKLVPACGNCHGSGIIKKEPEGHYSLGKTTQLKKYEKDFFIQCGAYRNKMIDDYFEIEVDVYYPSQRSDLDNSLKILLDCLQGIKAIKNDNKCTRIVCNKFVDKADPRIEFIIKPAMR